MTTKTKKRPIQATAPNAKIFKWRGGSAFGVDAQIVGEELERLEVRPGDYHKARDVLEAARNANSPLHPCFPWDDEQAAEAFRLNVCRNMLRTISVVIVREQKRVKQPVYLHVCDEDGPRYVRTEKVLSESDLKRRALDEVLTMLNGIRKRFEYISELEPVFEAIDRVNAKKQK